MKPGAIPTAREMRSPFDRHRLHHRHQSRLCHVIWEGVWQGIKRMIGSDNNDDGRICFIKIWLCSLRHTPVRGKVEVNIRFPICICGFFNTLEKITPSIRYDNIETIQLRRGPIYKRTGRIRIGDIQRLVHGASPVTFCCDNKPLRLLAVGYSKPQPATSHPA